MVPFVSDPLAVTLTVADTLLDGAGETTETFREPLPPFETLTMTGLEVASLPELSRTIATRECKPLVIFVVSHVIEYGTEVMAAPRLPLSSLNWTLLILAPESDGFATTEIAPETFAADAGDVIEITGLPPPAPAG